MTNTRRTLWGLTKILSLGLYVALTCACETTYDVEARWELDEGQTVAILPVNDPEFGGFLASPRGRRIAFYAAQYLGKEYADEVVIKPEAYLEQFDKLNREWYDKPLHERISDDADPSQLSDQEIASRVKADFLLFCEIDKAGGWQIQDQGSVNLFKGRSRINVRYYDNRGLKLKLLGTDTVTARYPNSYFKRDGVTTFDTTAEAIEKGLIRMSGRSLSQLFYDHDVDKADDFNIRFK